MSEPTVRDAVPILTGIAKDYIELRASGTPWILVSTQDVDGAIKRLVAVIPPGAEVPVQVVWNLAAGHRVVAGGSEGLRIASNALPPDTANKPFPLLGAAAKLPPGSVLFIEVPGSDFWRSDITVSAILNLRAPFKATSRCLVLLARPGAGDRLPPQLDADVPVLREELPDDAALRVVVDKVVDDNEVVASDDARTRAVANIRGMTAFAAENAAARKCLTGTLDADGLREVRRA